MDAEHEEDEANAVSEEDDDMVPIGKGFSLHKTIHSKLYKYQILGVLWFWDCFRRGRGGILGDDMGLGKTVQVISFLAGLFDMEEAHSVLLVMPLSLISNWENEMNRWAPGLYVKQFHGTSIKQRKKNLQKIQRKGGIMITTYGMVMSSSESFNSYEDEAFEWDLIVLDEGHKIKNPTKTSKSVREVRSKHRFILTGTPVQNNMKELWALFDFVTKGKLLGTKSTFMAQFGTPIEKARAKDATTYEQEMGNKMAESLRQLIVPVFLRRTKQEVLSSPAKSNNVAISNGKENADVSNNREQQLKAQKAKRKSHRPKQLSIKNDLIVWTYLSEIQEDIYRNFIQSERVKELLNSTRSPLAALTQLKKLSDHPRLFPKSACKELGLVHDETFGEDEDDQTPTVPSNRDVPLSARDLPDCDVLISESGKLGVLVPLVKRLKAEEHRCLIFSQSTKMLDIIEKILDKEIIKHVRLDGRVLKPADRHKIIKKFERNLSISCFLLTTQVGGVGLNLTSADRVIIFDPSWNPATDSQAVDRIYRIGQKHDVVIYRLISCGTIEEKIYRKQIFKNSLFKQTTGASKNPYRYFTSQELRELFVLDDPRSSKTQQQMHDLHGDHRDTREDFVTHLDFLKTLPSYGISHHDKLFSCDQVDETCDENQKMMIEQKVKHARNLLESEADRSEDPTRPLREIQQSHKNVRTIETGIRSMNISDRDDSPSPPQMDPSEDEVVGTVVNPIDLTMAFGRPSLMEVVGSPFISQSQMNSSRFARQSFAGPGHPLMNSTAVFTPGAQRELEFSFEQSESDTHDDAPVSVNSSSSVNKDYTLIKPENLSREIKRDCRSEKKKMFVKRWVENEEFSMMRINDTVDLGDSSTEYCKVIDQSTSPIQWSNNNSAVDLDVAPRISALRASGRSSMPFHPVNIKQASPQDTTTSPVIDSSRAHLSHALFMQAMEGSPSDSCGKAKMIQLASTIAISDGTSAKNSHKSSSHLDMVSEDEEENKRIQDKPDSDLVSEDEEENERIQDKPDSDLVSEDEEENERIQDKPDSDLVSEDEEYKETDDHSDISIPLINNQSYDVVPESLYETCDSHVILQNDENMSNIVETDISHQTERSDNDDRRSIGSDIQSVEDLDSSKNEDQPSCDIRTDKYLNDCKSDEIRAYETLISCGDKASKQDNDLVELFYLLNAQIIANDDLESQERCQMLAAEQLFLDEEI